MHSSPAWDRTYGETVDTRSVFPRGELLSVNINLCAHGPIRARAGHEKGRPCAREALLREESAPLEHSGTAGQPRRFPPSLRAHTRAREPEEGACNGAGRDANKRLPERNHLTKMTGRGAVAGTVVYCAHPCAHPVTRQRCQPSPPRARAVRDAVTRTGSLAATNKRRIVQSWQSCKRTAVCSEPQKGARSAGEINGARAFRFRDQSTGAWDPPLLARAQRPTVHWLSVTTLQTPRPRGGYVCGLEEPSMPQGNPPWPRGMLSGLQQSSVEY